MLALDDYALPFVGGIIERRHEGKLQVLVQTRIVPLQYKSIYHGTLEFTTGRLDKLYENVYDALAREIYEETGQKLKRIINDSQTEIVSPQKIDGAFGFRPFCCLQQLKDGRPWVGFIFRCEVEDSTLVDQPSETKDVHWHDAADIKNMVANSPEKLFTLDIPAWQYYFDEVEV